MKVLFAVRSGGQFLYFKSIIEALCKKGHAVRLIFDPGWTKETSISKLQNFRNSFAGFSFGKALRRNDFSRKILFHIREIRTYRSYLREPRKNLRIAYQERWRRYLPHALRSLFIYKLPRVFLASGLPGFVLDALENFFRPDPKIIDDIKAFGPDVVLASPVNMRFSSADLEYLKAAKYLGIPTAIPVFSWDNLTTKGLYHVLPDILLVWNNAHAKEATAHQGISPEKIKIIGAPLFDEWFLNPPGGRAGNKPASSRADFCGKFGLREKDHILLYLGSSKNIASDESWLVADLRKALDNAKEPALRNAQIIIRPHPANSDIYENLKLNDVILIPKKGTLPDTDDALQIFRDSLEHSAAVFNINTSAMIEAIITGKPLIALVTEKYKDAQMDMEYFRQLITTDAAAMAKSPEEAVEITAQILAGHDTRIENRKNFVREFIRPNGLDKSAGECAAEEIEKLANYFRR